MPVEVQQELATQVSDPVQHELALQLLVEVQQVLETHLEFHTVQQELATQVVVVVQQELATQVFDPVQHELAWQMLETKFDASDTDDNAAHQSPEPVSQKTIPPPRLIFWTDAEMLAWLSMMAIG